jgi:hypothetical protein
VRSFANALQKAMGSVMSNGGFGSGGDAAPAGDSS